MTERLAGDLVTTFRNTFLELFLEVAVTVLVLAELRDAARTVVTTVHVETILGAIVVIERS